MQLCTKALWLYLLSYLHLGLSIFTTSPTNVTVCQGSPAVFTCAIDVLKQVNWYINGNDYNSLPGAQVSQSGNQSTLSVSDTSQLSGSSIQCSYIQSGSVIYSNLAYLSVQAPPTAPCNFSITAFNTNFTILVWEPPPNIQSPSLLSYGVEVRNGSGVVVYRGTVTVPQLIISTPDPCDLYEATVTAQYMIANLTCTGSSSSKLLGVSPSTVQFNTSLVFSMSSQDNVSVNMSVQCQSGVCYYKVVAISGSDVFLFPSVKPLPQYGGGQFNITISLPSNKYYNLTVTAFNGYGNISSNVVISTFGVIDISVNPSSPTGLVCVFNPGSLAIGCLVSLTDTSTGTIYCKVIGRTLNRTVSVATCPSSNGPLSTGSYSVVVYTIESDGRLSPLPAISGKQLNISTTVGPSTVSQAPSSIPTTSNATLLGCIIGGVLGGLAIIIIIIIIVVVVILCVRKKQKQKPHSGSGNVELQEQGNYAIVKMEKGSTSIDETECQGNQEGEQETPNRHQRQEMNTESKDQELDRTKKELAHVQQEVGIMKNELATKEKMMKEQMAVKDKKEEQLAAKEQELDAIKKKLEAQDKMMEEQLAAKDKMMEEQLAAKDKMEEQLAAKDKMMKEQLAAKDKMEEQLAAKDQELDTIKKELADVKQELGKMQEQLTSGEWLLKLLTNDPKFGMMKEKGIEKEKIQNPSKQDLVASPRADDEQLDMTIINGIIEDIEGIDEQSDMIPTEEDTEGKLTTLTSREQV